MKQNELKKIVKEIIINQGGTLTGANYLELKATHGISWTQFQNAMNYFQFSPTQESFRNKYNFH